MAVPVPVKQTVEDVGNIMEAVIAKGDLGKLTPEERVQFYQETCRSLGLNPLTQPFSYITLNNKLTLYATRACTDQLRKVNGVSLEIVSRQVADDILTVHVRARLPDGRTDEDLGSVPFPATLKGEFRANAELKAVTKAKRRATLSICGLGWLDETEVESLPATAKRPSPAVIEPHDAETGEIVDAPTSDQLALFDEHLAQAAEQGTEALKTKWGTLPDNIQIALKAAVNRRHKPRAAEVDSRDRS